MAMRTINGSIKIREKHRVFRETGSPFDATPIHSIKVGTGQEYHQNTRAEQSHQ